ncbi:hypothetical protein F3Y33_25525 (plasmid) [Rhizobium sp. BG6]|nr:hypothetical protein F3Y33_25525 [Rhizobium sp. BG6]
MLAFDLVEDAPEDAGRKRRDYGAFKPIGASDVQKPCNKRLLKGLLVEKTALPGIFHLGRKKADQSGKGFITNAKLIVKAIAPPFIDFLQHRPRRIRVNSADGHVIRCQRPDSWEAAGGAERKETRSLDHSLKSSGAIRALRYGRLAPQHHVVAVDIVFLALDGIDDPAFEGNSGPEMLAGRSFQPGAFEQPID